MTAQPIGRRLAWFGVVVVLSQHLGPALGPISEAADTRWTDWPHLAVPYLVVGTAGAALAAARPHPLAWMFFAAAGVLYTQGHGIHLAANAIAAVEPSNEAHLWDETVGHWLWYGGLAGLVGSLAHALDAVPSIRNAWSLTLTVAYGLMIFTTSVEGGTAALGLLSGLVFVAWGLRRRGRLPELLVPAYTVTLACLVGWGVYWHGFPQFSELGWI